MPSEGLVRGNNIVKIVFRLQSPVRHTVCFTFFLFLLEDNVTAQARDVMVCDGCAYAHYLF